MDIIFPDNGLVRILLNMVSDGFVYQLYTNDYTPTLDDTISSYSQANWSGYAPVTVLASDFVLEEVTAHVGGIQAGPIAYANTSGSDQVIYGYFVTDLSATYLLAAARFDLSPITLPNGSVYTVVPLVGNFSGLTS
jgi:hypothetical protein